MARAGVRLFGYPFHPTLVVFPVALLPLSLAAQLASVVLGLDEAWRAAYWMIVLAALAAAASVATGLLDLRRVRERAARRLALWHGGLGGSVLAASAALAVAHAPDAPTPTQQWVMVAANAAVNLAMGLGAFLGGRLVYTHHVGVEDAARR